MKRNALRWISLLLAMALLACAMPTRASAVSPIPNVILTNDGILSWDHPDSSVTMYTVSGLLTWSSGHDGGTTSYNITKNSDPSWPITPYFTWSDEGISFDLKGFMDHIYETSAIDIVTTGYHTITIRDWDMDYGSSVGYYYHTPYSTACTIAVTHGKADRESAFAGEIVTVSAEIPEGEVFTGWTCTPSDVVLSDPSSPTMTFPMPDTGVFLVAHSQKCFEVSVTGGKAGKTPIVIGETVSITADLKPGDVFDHWQVDDYQEEMSPINLTIADPKSPSTSFVLNYLSATLNTVKLTAVLAETEEYEADKTALNQAFSDAGKIKADEYTADSYAKLEQAVTDAEDLAFDAPQEAVDAAAKAIRDAIAGLVKKSGAFRFSDVKNEKAFYFDAVYWAYNAVPQITNGLDKTHFGPDAGCTRGQVVTFLWRAAKCPEPKSTKTAFTDVGEKAFYAKAVAWAVEEGITNGMSADRFAPDATCTRGQIVTFLWRFRHSPAPANDQTGFADVDAKAFYAKAVAWAVEKKITNGMSADRFAPNATCTRGQIVTFLYRAMNDGE